MKRVQIDLSEFDKKILEHDLQDVKVWIQEALDGKINNVKKRLIKEAQEKLFNDPNIENIPANPNGLIVLYFEQSYYKNRKQRSVDT